MSRLGLAAIALFVLSAPASARPTDLIVDQPVEIRELPPGGLVPYNTLFINRCASGCPVRVGTSNSINDTWQIGSNRTLTAFPYGDAVWQQVMDCVKDVMEPYNIQVTDVDPGSANHFEIMVAGSPTDLGMPTSIGGVAPGNGSCTGYINNALVFDFAKVWGSSTTCGSGCVEDICSTAAQEIGHTWHALDHTIVNTDPMTYFGSTTRKYYQNTAAQCGSDCVGGQSPTGFTCSGTNNQSHPCICGGNTQNSDQTLISLFGAGPGSPPTVKITAPKVGQSVDPGFSVYSDAMDNSGIVTKVELRIDGNVISTLMSGPYVFNSPATLGNGTHKVEVDAYDPHGYKGSAIVDVIIGPPCQSSNDCPMNDVCIGGRCVPGSGVAGGLGTTCMADADCVSGHCQADDQGNKYCVEPCMIGQCPSSFGCLTPDGSDMGVCWPGYDDGSGGGCGCQSSKGGPLSISVLFGWVVLTWRRRRGRS